MENMEERLETVSTEADYGIMKDLHDMMSLEIDLSPPLSSGDDHDPQKWQRQYVEYSIKVKELLRKLLRKLEDNYQYQRYLEDEIKILEHYPPTNLSEGGLTPPSVINRPSRDFSSIISSAVNLMATSNLRSSPSNVVFPVESEITPDTYENIADQADETDEENSHSILNAKKGQLIKSDPQLEELQQLRRENAQLKEEVARAKSLREKEMHLILTATLAMSERVKALNSHYGE